MSPLSVSGAGRIHLGLVRLVLLVRVHALLELERQLLVHEKALHHLLDCFEDVH